MNSHIQLQHEQYMVDFGSSIYLPITTPHLGGFFQKQIPDILFYL